MNHLYKLIIGCLLVCYTILTTSCADLLDQEPQGEWTADDNKGGSFASDVFTLYAKGRGFHVTSGNTALAIHNFRCEDIEKGSTASDGSAYVTQFSQFSYSPSMSAIGTYWTENYAIVHVANNILAAIEETDPASLSEGDMINKGEAHFFRAFIYFNLVRAFGEVPLIDFAIKDAIEANVPKSSVDAIYQLIDADLTEAATYLPKSWENQYPGRLTWGAAVSLHAKTYMQRNDWANMLALSKEVINSGLYNLNTPFSTIFREEGENCSESIWELQCTSTAEKPGSNDIGSQYSAVQACRGAGDFNMGWGWHCPTPILANAFEAGDPRKDETLLYFYKTGEDPATCPANSPYNEKLCASADVTNTYYNKKSYSNPTLRAQYTKGGYWVNIRMIRYSEVLLMAAEAANETGDTQSALNYLEEVRARARSGNSAILPKVTSTDKNVVRAAVKHERRIELAMEWDRFYDLVRWGDAQSVLAAAGKNYQPKHQYLPLPQTEIDKSNGVLVQNPNY
ncbi:MAG: RagB/SusD family nutrient uptake outer membrane protein [Dysgonamonadaceae bacterium]|jgi:hypothetical protein|nr:RagB/SusD family nutrient uptake outer membrane protein [Dysgonamonadaceae bacterium]